MKASFAIGASLAGAALLIGPEPNPALGGGNSGTDCNNATGPDVIVGVLTGVTNYASTGGIEAFSVGTTSCNIGDLELLWFSQTSEHPVIAQNMFRHKDGRFEQVGQAWLKHGFFALQGDACGCGCSPAPSGSTLGVGCSDPYSSSLNGGQNGLGPKFEVNAATGEFPFPPTDFQNTGDSVYKRLRVHISDLDPAQQGGGTYYVEGQYVTPDDADWGNQNNNASYRQIGVSGSGTNWSASFSGMPDTQREQPAIRAWQDADPSVVETDVQVPGDGLIIVAAKTTDLGSGWYHYEYAVQNLNSDRSVGAFSVPIDDAVAVSNIGFHDVDYHSGEPYDGTDWTATTGGGAITWSTSSHASDPNANALRWGTLYNFRFDAAAPPATVNVTLDLFKPGTPDSVAALTTGPDVGAPATGACCVNMTCSVETQAECAALRGTWLGGGTDCSGDPCVGGCPVGEVADCFGNCAPESWIGDGTCDDGSNLYNGVPIFFNCPEFGNDGGDCDVPGDLVNLVTADLETPDGSISAGSYLDTHLQDDVHEALTERHTGGPPSQRRSRLTHTWTVTVAAGTSYEFFVDAHHDANLEGDDFVFSYSLDNVDFTPMVTVTKTSDDDVLQSYAFTEDVSGLVYLRVQDTDDTPGNGIRDTVYVDEMFIVSVGSGPDTTPPAAPAGLIAAGGDGVVTLDWSDNDEPDLVGYLAYRSTTSGGPYAQITPAPIAASDYADTSVTNGTAYFYVVTAVDTAANESVASNEAVATPQGPGGGPTSVHVAAIELGIVNAGGGLKLGRANVTIVNDLGDPVSGASVTGGFTGDFNEKVTATTDASGVASLVTLDTQRGSIHFTFCVDDVVHALVYDPSENVVTCEIR